MKIIESIRIKYYRSILNTTRGSQTHLNTSDLNIIVGSNDVGKSNYLKALNLFFNNYSEPNQPFVFWNEYSFQRHGIRKEENRIEIELIINPPKKQNFKNSFPVRWTKIWKENSNLPTEKIEYINGVVFTNNNRSAYYKWLKKIKFKYIPAIKSEKYFSDLMYNLYDVLQKDTHELEQEFNKQIKDNTSLISEQISRRLKIESVLQFKGSFRDLFDTLQFGSIDGKLMLKHRGDGVKVRHIPVILQSIAEAELKEARNREPISNTIWGFEEPENNLEFDSAKKLAESFIEYTKRIHFQDEYNSQYDEGIQIFITTHSPIFYTLTNSNLTNINSFYVSKTEDGVSTIRNINNEQSILIEKEMKLLPLIELSKHWKDIKQKVDDLHIENETVKKQLETFTNNHKCIFLTEDKKQGLVEKLLTVNGFKKEEIDLRSYNGCTSINSAMVLNDFLKDKFKQNYPQIIVHRDKDYLTSTEVEIEIEKFKKLGIKLFITEGTDIESYFVRKSHIFKCHPEINEEQIDIILKKALYEKRNIAIDALKRKEYGEKFKDKSSHLSEFLDNYYNQNEMILFHGKEVFKKVKSLIQEQTSKNSKIESESDSLIDEKLLMISKELWK
jgi:energy-coupling factor transporter ATP-binding protein EcfA2